MIKDDEESSGSGREPTRVDLGDDLVEKTAIFPGVTPPATTPASLEDQLHSAQILFNEGFPEEAKKILRQIQMADPSHRDARKLLELIHETELKQMFRTSEPPVRKSFLNPLDDTILSADSEQVIRLLDRDMNLSLGRPIQNLDFFSDKKLLDQFADRADREIGDLPQDRFDLAIGFIEMGLYSVAIKLLQALTNSANEAHRLNAVALVVHALLADDNPYAAVSALQPILNDSEIDSTRKTECFFLMGRALEAISSYAEAMGWYFQVQGSDADYRDVTERISRCKSALKRK